MQLFPLKLIPNNPNWDFMKIRKISYFLSILLVVASIISISVFSFNFGIDFAGGISMEVRTKQAADLTQLRQALNQLELGEVMLQNFGSQQDLSIRIGVSDEDKLAENIELIKNSLANFPEYEFEYRKIDFVGPQIGSQMIRSGIISMLLAFISIMIYVWIRFEWYFGFGVLIALIHDVIIGLGFMSVSAYDFNLSTIAAILTIIGYSVNNSVVIYDRVRENLRKNSKKTMNIIINSGINETLSRTIITALTTLLANFALIILGGEAIKSFSILVFLGIFIGTYSSIFISAPILTLFNFKNSAK